MPPVAVTARVTVPPEQIGPELVGPVRMVGSSTTVTVAIVEVAVPQSEPEAEMTT